MRCPKCGRFCKEVKVPGKGGGMSIYADCSACGRILVEEVRINRIRAYFDEYLESYRRGIERFGVWWKVFTFSMISIALVFIALAMLLITRLP
jgi:hypothetical protein